MYDPILLLRKMFKNNFGRPNFDVGDDKKIHDADRTIAEIRVRRKDLERRLKLLEIQSTPRGPINE